MQEQRTVEGLTLVGGDCGREVGRADGARTGDGAAAELWTVDGRRRRCAGCRRAWKFSAA